MRQTGQECAYRLTTRLGGRGDTQQSIVFEIEGALGARIRFECGEHTQTFTLKELMEDSRVLVFRRDVENRTRRQIGSGPISAGVSEDYLYANAYKVKFHRAIPEKGYTATLEFSDGALECGRNFYYVRASQVNGQYAWSSPIWVDL